MAGGYVAPPEAPDPYKDERIYPMIAFNEPVQNPEPALRSFLSSHGITAVVLAQADSARAVWLPLLERLGWTPQEVGDATLLRRAPPVNAEMALPRIRTVVTSYLERLAAGDAAGACQLLSPEGIAAVTGGLSDCRTALARTLQASNVSTDAGGTTYEGATLIGTRADVVMAAPGNGRLRLPVRLVGRNWRIDGPVE